MTSRWVSMQAYRLRRHRYSAYIAKVPGPWYSNQSGEKNGRWGMMKTVKLTAALAQRWPVSAAKRHLPVLNDPGRPVLAVDIRHSLSECQIGILLVT